MLRSGHKSSRCSSGHPCSDWPTGTEGGDARRSPDTGLQLLCLTALHRLHTSSTCMKSHNRTHTHMLPWNRVSTLGGHTDDALSPSSNIRPFSQPAYGVTHTYICMYTHRRHIHTISAAVYYLHNHREDQFTWTGAQGCTNQLETAGLLLI